MASFTPAEIARAKTAVPAAIVDFLESPDFKNEIFEISTLYKLNLQGVAELADIVTFTLLGLESQSSFSERIATSHINLGARARNALISHVDRKIFSEIKRRMQVVPTKPADDELV